MYNKGGSAGSRQEQAFIYNTQGRGQGEREGERGAGKGENTQQQQGTKEERTGRKSDATRATRDRRVPATTPTRSGTITQVSAAGVRNLRDSEVVA